MEENEYETSNYLKIQTYGIGTYWYLNLRSQYKISLIKENFEQANQKVGREITTAHFVQY